MPDTFYSLVTHGTVQPGDHVSSYHPDKNPKKITADPRHLQPSDDAVDYLPPDLIIGPLGAHSDDADRIPRCDIARLAPCGEVTEARWFASLGDHECKGTQFVCPAGWEVVAIDRIDGLLGPNAPFIIAAMQTAERCLVRDHGGPAYLAYQDATEARLDHPFHDLDQDAAEGALGYHGADGYWWTRWGWRCYGPEFTALAARDLIGTTASWTQEAYDRLTAPWVAAFGRPIHPADSLRVVTARPPRALVRFGRELKRRAFAIGLPFSPCR